MIIAKEKFRYAHGGFRVVEYAKDAELPTDAAEWAIKNSLAVEVEDEKKAAEGKPDNKKKGGGKK